MKKLGFLFLFSLCFATDGFTQQLDSLKNIHAVLDKTERYIKRLQNITYKASYRSVSSAQEDSVYTASGQVWMQQLLSDSIFKSKFHIKGEAKGGATFDYFYDGVNSFDVLHREKTVLVINPRQFPNNENNRAKTRISMFPFNYYLTDTALKKHLLEKKPLLSMQTLAGQYIVKFDYPINKNGLTQTLKLSLDSRTHAINEVSSITNYNGVRYQSDTKYSNIVLNDASTLFNIPIKEGYKDYVINEIKPPDATAVIDPDLLGKHAPEFQYPTFDNQVISLTSLKGKYVLLDFWESWCGHCILSLPKMQKLYETYHPKGLEVIGITTENSSKIKELIKANGLGYQTLNADKKILTSYEVNGRPTYILIDPSAKIIAYGWGGDLEKITKLLNSKLD